MRHLRQFSRKYSKNVICDKSFILQETPWRISMGSLFMQNVLILEHVNALNFVNNEYTISGSDLLCLVLDN